MIFIENNEWSKHKDEGWSPDVEGGEDAFATEERSLAIAESGQFATGGYYNQQTVNQADRRSLDEDDIIPPGRR